MSKKFFGLEVVILSILFGAAISYAAWTEPTVAPPDGNVAAPLNVGPDGQSKSGGLILNTGGATNGLIVDKGNVGIGTANPTDILHIYGSDPHINIGFNTAPTGVISALEFSDSSGAVNARVQYQRTGENLILDYNYDGDATGNFMIQNNQINKLTILNNGNVGIGTMEPSAKLEVASPGDYTSIRIKNLESTPGVWELRSMQTPTNNNGLTIWGGGQGSEGDRLVITSNGNVGIGRTDPWEVLTVQGNIWASGSVTEWSDISAKKDISEIENALEKILSLRGVSFIWKDTGKPDLGLIAQEVEGVFPELVSDSPAGLGIQYTGLIAPLIEAIKEQQSEIESLRAEIKELKILINK